MLLKKSNTPLGEATASATSQSLLELTWTRTLGPRIGGRGRDGAVAPLHAGQSADPRRLQLFPERRVGSARPYFQLIEGSDQ